MNILAFDTSGNNCSVGLSTAAEEVDVIEQPTHRQHASLILPLIEELLQQKNLSLANIDLIAFSNGPGSFTGIRLAASVAQALSFSLNTPLIPISSLQCLAQGAYKEFSASKALIAINAFAGSIYWGLYGLKNGIMQPEIEDRRSAPEELMVPLDTKMIAVGDAWAHYQQTIACPIREIYQRSINIRDLIYLASYFYTQADFCPSKNVSLNYLYDKNSWKKSSN